MPRLVRIGVDPVLVLPDNQARTSWSISMPSTGLVPANSRIHIGLGFVPNVNISTSIPPDVGQPLLPGFQIGAGPADGPVFKGPIWAVASSGAGQFLLVDENQGRGPVASV